MEPVGQAGVDGGRGRRDAAEDIKGGEIRLGGFRRARAAVAGARCGAGLGLGACGAGDGAVVVVVMMMFGWRDGGVEELVMAVKVELREGPG